MLRKNYMVTDRQVKLLLAEAATREISSSEMLRRILDKYFSEKGEGK